MLALLQLGGVVKLRLTKEVKTAAVISAKRRYDEQLGPRKKGCTAITEEVANHFGCSGRSLREWINQVAQNGEVTDDHRGGDRRSINVTNPKTSTAIYDCIIAFMADKHNHSANVTVREIYNHLLLNQEIVPFFPNIWRLYRYLHLNGINYERINKYEGLRNDKWVIERRKYYIQQMLINEYVLHILHHVLCISNCVLC